jgi:hypothetical protein
MSQRTAQCTCGQLTITVTGEPQMVAMCNCIDCQRRSGSQFGSGAFFERPNAAIEGEYKSFTRAADSGKNLTNHFCPHCGTNIAWEAEIRPGWIGVAVGAFADPNFPPPTVVLYDRSRHPWVTPPAGARVVPPGARPPR